MRIAQFLFSPSPSPQPSKIINIPLEATNSLSGIMVIITSTAAERITEKILSIYDGKILSIAIIDNRVGKAGDLLATKSVESFENEFGVLQEGQRYGGSLAIASLSISNELREFAGETIIVSTTYQKCKMMLIPIPSHEILVGFVLKRGAAIDEDRITSHIEGLVADNAATSAFQS